MEFIEREAAKALRDRLKMILPNLKAAYYSMKRLEEDYDWDFKSPEMCEAYMTLADVYLEVVESLEEDKEGEKRIYNELQHA